MSARGKRNTAKKSPSTVNVPRDQWNQFLRSFTRQHHRRLVTLETHDLETGENVVSHETPLESVELDLEDEKNPRINVIVDLDNKVIKHILFQPSQLILHRSERGAGEALHIDSVNTATTIQVGRTKEMTT